MLNIHIDRYPAEHAKNVETGRGFSGHISGADDSGQGWILWLDETGRPCVYYGARDADGAVTGEPVHLAPYPA